MLVDLCARARDERSASALAWAFASSSSCASRFSAEANDLPDLAARAW